MNRISKSALLLSIGTLIVGAAIGGGATYGYLRHENKILTPVTDQPKTPAPNERKADVSLPDGTVSPTTIVNDIKKYTDKNVKVRGLIIETGDNAYVIAGQETKEPGALAVDFTKSNVNPTEYVASYADQQKSAQKGGTGNPVTLAGKLNNTQGRVTFIVDSVTR